MKYKVKVTQTLQKVVEVEADSIAGATTKVIQDYANGKIILGDEDLIVYSIKEYKEEK